MTRLELLQNLKHQLDDDPSCGHEILCKLISTLIEDEVLAGKMYGSDSSPQSPIKPDEN